MRANRDELIERGILLPESPMTTIPEPGNVYKSLSIDSNPSFLSSRVNPRERIMKMIAPNQHQVTYRVCVSYDIRINLFLFSKLTSTPKQICWDLMSFPFI